jgi:hypothetical protein
MGLYIYKTVFWVAYMQATGKVVKEFTGHNVTMKSSKYVIW